MSTYSLYRRWIGDTVNNGVAWKTPSCICSYQWCIKSEVFCGNCWTLRRWVAGEACNMMENALSIWIVIFSVHLQQTEISERKLFIFHLSLFLMSLSECLFLTSESLFLTSDCLFRTSESHFIWVYNQTLPTKLNQSESLFPTFECLFPTPR